MELLFSSSEKRRKIVAKNFIVSQIPLLGYMGEKNPRTQTQHPLPSPPLFKQLA